MPGSIACLKKPALMRPPWGERFGWDGNGRAPKSQLCIAENILLKEESHHAFWNLHGV
jgi:hypothetical protein